MNKEKEYTHIFEEIVARNHTTVEEVRREMEIVSRLYPSIHILTSTNGALLDSDDKREAALLFDHILFSIDGVSTEKVRRYQRGGDFDKSYENLKRLVAFRNARHCTTPRITWKYVVFR